MHVYTTVYRDAELLPHFIRHYETIGCAGIHVLVNTNGLSEVSREIVRRHSAYVVRTYSAEFSAPHRTAVEMEEKNRMLGTGQFYAAPDLDEFFKLPVELKQLVSEMRWHDYIEGVFVDRIAADGSFPPIEQGNVWDIFPIDCHLTRDVLRGYDTKVMCLRSEFNVAVGKHQPVEAGLRRLPQSGSVFHFKWHARVLERLRERSQLLRKQKLPWFEESDRFLEHVATYGRIELEAVRRASSALGELQLTGKIQNSSAPPCKRQTIAVIGPEGAGTRAIAGAIAQLAELPFFDFHDWFYRLKQVTMPAVIHISLPNGRPRDILLGSCPNLASVAWANSRVLRSIDASLKVILVSRTARDAIYSAYRRFFNQEFLHACPVGVVASLESIQLAIVFHYLAIARQEDFRRQMDSIDVSYEQAVEEPEQVFQRVREFLGFGKLASDYGLQKVPSSWSSDAQVSAAFDHFGVP